MTTRAVLLWLPGGGWRGDSGSTGAELAGHDLRVVPATYRLAPAHRWPTQLEDVRAAARLVRDSAGGLPLLVAGDSAGAHLALHLGLRGIDAPGDVAGVLAFSPPVDPLAADWPQAWVPESAWFDLLGYSPAPDDPATVDANPTTHLGTGVPVLLVHGIDDAFVPASQSVALTAALLAAGHPVHTLLTHGGHCPELDRPDVAAAIGAFLTTTLGVPGPDPAVRISVAIPADAGELLTLQRAAYVTEGQLYDDARLPPLTQTYDELLADLVRCEPDGLALKATLGTRIVGTVRGRVADGTLHIGRLAVAPDQQGRGVGTALLAAIERAAPAGVEAFELFTGHRSEPNIRLYLRVGYVLARPAGPAGIVHLSKVALRAG